MNGHASAAPRRRIPARGSRLPVRGARGFTLIEMIAAFVIFAIAVGSLMQILTISMNNARRSVDETRAALWAQSLLDNVGIGERIEAGGTNGRFDDRYRWELTIEQIDPMLVAATGNEAMTQAASGGLDGVGNTGSGSPISELAQMELYHVDLVVAWGERARERTAHFTTLRAVMPDLSQGMQLGGSGPLRGGGGSRQSAGSPSAAQRDGSARRDGNR